ncbi:MAG TPA: penicillin-binding protein 2, partial [Tepidisphaeraceae bacterium]|nr:penicillin-binding protein 2 [Tepidisphaeraceae bacterium]
MLLIGTGFVGLIGRVAYLQTYGRQQTIERADRQQHQSEILRARRGSIFDANGMLMAGTVQTQSLYVDPKFMQDCYQEDGKSLVMMDQDIDKLAKLIDKDPIELSQLIGDKSTSRFVKIAEHLDDRTVAEIDKLDMPGLGTMPTDERYYPMGSIAAHVLGGVQKDNIGLEGIELKYEKLLAGKAGFKRVLKDARRRPIAVAAEDYLPPQNGQHLILTIDSNIQMIAEQELARACTDNRAKRGEVVVMDPRTGDVLALGNWPNFNPQNLEDSKPETRRNRVLTDPYEPGSTIKPFVAGPAIAWKVSRPGEVFPIHGPHYKSPLRSKLVTDVHGYDSLALWDVLVKSSNIGMTMLGERMGKEKVYRAFNSFQFGHQTGIELPGEDPGLVKPLAKWGTSDLVSAVQGYSVMVTPLQLARGFCAYANGGRLVDPHLIKGVLDSDGEIVSRTKPSQLELMPEAVDRATSLEVRRILADVPIRGTARGSRSAIYNIFGKTGSAHISQGAGGYANKYTSSFLCGAPFENPRLVVAMIVHEPDAEYAKAHNMSYYGGAVAAPGATRLVDRALAYLQVPGSPALPPPPPQIAAVLYDYHANVYDMKSSASARD